MPLPTLDSLTDRLDEATVGLLGDPITIYPEFGAPIAVNGFVDYSEGRREFGVSAATDQPITIQLRVADIPGRPGKEWRATLPKLPGKTFGIKNVHLDEGGTLWSFDLVPA
jgi:hypothetical protein